MISEDKYEVRVCYLTFFFGISILRAVVRGALLALFPGSGSENQIPIRGF
jgi:hypothetical protein